MMEITIFKNDSLIDTVMDETKYKEWLRLSESLGIEHDNQVRPIPFLLLNQRMVKMFQVLCPVMVKLGSYNREPIPLEVLKVAKFCDDESFFAHMEIWYDDKSPDPVLIGVTKQKYIKSWYYNTTEVPPKELHGKPITSLTSQQLDTIPKSAIEERDIGKYLIAKWGDEDKPFSVLREFAARRMRDAILVRAHQAIREANREIDDIDTTIFNELPQL
jgi:hypothetical protein